MQNLYFQKLKIAAQMAWLRFRLHPLIASKNTGFYVLMLGVTLPTLIKAFTPPQYQSTLLNVLVSSMFTFFIIFMVLLMHQMANLFMDVSTPWVQRSLAYVYERVEKIYSFFSLDDEKKLSLQEQLQKLALDLERAQLGGVTKKAPMRKNSNRI